MKTGVLGYGGVIFNPNLRMERNGLNPPHNEWNRQIEMIGRLQEEINSLNARTELGWVSINIIGLK